MERGAQALVLFMGFPGWLRQQRICLQCRRPVFNPWIRKIPWRREWQPTPVFLPGESRGQRSLVGYTLWGCKELDMTEWLTHTCLPSWSFLVQTSLFCVLGLCHSFKGCALPPSFLFQNEQRMYRSTTSQTAFLFFCLFNTGEYVEYITAKNQGQHSQALPRVSQSVSQFSHSVVSDSLRPHES